MIAEPRPAEPVRQPLGRARIAAARVVRPLRRAPGDHRGDALRQRDPGRRRRVRLPRLLRRRRGDARRRLALPGARRRVGGRGARVRLSADHRDRSRSRSRSCRSRPRVCSSWRFSSARRSPSRTCSACATGAATGCSSSGRPCISAVQTGNVTILLALGAALAWRYRDRTRSERVGCRRDAGGEVHPLAARRLAGGDAPPARGSGALWRSARRSCSARGRRSASRGSPTTRTCCAVSRTSSSCDSYTVYVVGARRGCVDDRRTGAVARCRDRRSRVRRGRRAAR